MAYLKTINFPEQIKLITAAKENKKRLEDLVINNDDDKKMFGKERAKTNKIIKEFKTEAKTVRDKVIGEYDTKVKELITILDETQLLCKEKVEHYDQAWKDERASYIRKAIDIRISDNLSEFVTSTDLLDHKFMNTTMTEKKIAEALDEKISKIKSDLAIAQAISPQVEAIFKECLDVTVAIAKDKQQQEEQAKREAIAKADAERKERERQEALMHQKEREREAMIQSELTEAKKNGEVIDSDKIREINQKANSYAEKEAIKKASFIVTFEFKDSNYPMAWQNPLADLEERLQGLENVEVIEND